MARWAADRRRGLALIPMLWSPRGPCGRALVSPAPNSMSMLDRHPTRRSSAVSASPAPHLAGRGGRSHRTGRLRGGVAVGQAALGRLAAYRPARSPSSRGPQGLDAWQAPSIRRCIIGLERDSALHRRRSAVHAHRTRLRPRRHRAVWRDHEYAHAPLHHRPIARRVATIGTFAAPGCAAPPG